MAKEGIGWTVRRLSLATTAVAAALACWPGPDGASAATPPDGGSRTQAGSAGPGADGTLQTVRGEVMMISADVCVVKDASGKSQLLNLGKNAKIEGQVKEGARVEAQVDANGNAVSLKAVK
ncbi:MAG: hypothetical protein AB1411_13200 [Nitrospirota bacterium]